MVMKSLLTSLNPPQAEAVVYTEGPLLILAGAGSGKTKTLTHRIAYLIAMKKVAPTEVLAVTFTNKAAGEMRFRVAGLLGRPAFDRTFMPFLGTFHAVCVRLLRTEAETLGLSRRFVIFDEQDSLATIKQAMRKLRIDEKRWQPSLIKNLISQAKNELIDPLAYSGYAQGAAQKLAAAIYKDYQQLLAANQALDFDDLLFKVVQLFREQPAVLSKWQRQFRYILIDEYQDTNRAQYELARLLAQKHRNICVVGDDWQSIYSWRGANYRNILEFERDWPDAKVVKLEQNYRSSQSIIDAAQAIITKNERRSEKKLWTNNPAGSPVRIWPVTSETAEAELVAKTIRSAINKDARTLKDFVVLYRANAQSRPLEEVFIRHSLPYRIVGGVRFYERKEIKDALAFLRFIYQPDDEVAFKRIINLPPRGLGAKSLAEFSAFRETRGLSILGALGQIEQAASLSPKARASFTSFNRLITELVARAQELKVDELIQLLLKRSGYLDYLNDGSILAADRIENVQELISVAQGYEDLDLATFLEEVALVADIDSYDNGAEAVTLMTLHAVKGLEFPIVFMVGMEEGVFPHARSLLDPDQLEEERRLCYVGMTRAREELNLVYATARLLHGQMMHNPPARFLSEIEDKAELGAISSAGAPGRSETTAPTDFKHGQLVRHAQFGTGTVIGINGDEISVDFDDNGVKELSLRYAGLDKL